MRSALVVSSGEKNTDFICQMLERAGLREIAVTSLGGKARRLMIEREVDLCVINAPLQDEFGEELAVDIAERGMGEVILLVPAALFDEMSEKVENFGVMTLSKPLSRTFMWNALKMAQASRKKMMRVQSENRRLLQKIEDIKVVDRAKYLLITCLSMSEPEAHRYIERRAMDSRASKKAVAEEIIKTYEN